MANKVGRPREAQVKRELRQCEKHGLTDFAATITGNGAATLHYRCMLCQCERNKKYRDDIAAGIRFRTTREEPKKKAVCPHCFTELPATGICDFD